MGEIIEEKGGGSWKQKFNERFRKEEGILNKRKQSDTKSDASKGTGGANKETSEERLLRNLMNSVEMSARIFRNLEDGVNSRMGSRVTVKLPCKRINYRRDDNTGVLTLMSGHEGEGSLRHFQML